jgi:hypothetical protein
MKIKDVVAKRLKYYQTKSDFLYGVIGNLATGVVEVPDKTSTVYVTLHSGVTLDNVKNTRVPNIMGLEVKIGFDSSDMPNTLQVLSVKDGYYGLLDNPATGATWHHKQHEWPYSDTVYVAGEQLTPSLYKPVAGTLTVDIYPGTYKITSGYKHYTQITNVDLGDTVGDVTNTHASICVIVVDSDGDFQVRPGALVDDQDSPYLSAYMMLTDSDIPTLTAGDNPICAVKIFHDQTQLHCDGQQNDFIDLRFGEIYSPAGAGDVVGPAGANDGYLAVFDGASGKLLKSGGPPGGGAGHTIQDEGSPMTTRTNLNFVGATVEVTDDNGNDATVVTVVSTVSPGSKLYSYYNLR